VQAFLKNYEFVQSTFDGPFFAANFTSTLICNALEMKSSGSAVQVRYTD
jgi:hypothetical protein